MVIVYDSMTGNARRFANRVAEGLEVKILDLRRDNLEEIGDYILITHTFGRGEVPETTRNFLTKHGGELRAVCSSGSIHWGEMFGKAGEIISEEYSVPLLVKFNKSGTGADVEAARSWLICNG